MFLLIFGAFIAFVVWYFRADLKAWFLAKESDLEADFPLNLDKPAPAETLVKPAAKPAADVKPGA